MKYIKIVVWVYLLINLSSCMVVGVVLGGKKTTFEKQFVLKNQLSAEANKTKFKEIIYSQGWNKVSDEGLSAVFTKKISILKEVAFSKTEEYRLFARFMDNSIELEITQHGNFKTGTEEKTTRTFRKIKQSFIE